MNESPSVLFRSDGSAEIGLGHVVRCLALADEMRDAHGCRIAFAMRCGPPGYEMVGAKGYPVLTPPNNGRSFEYSRWLTETAGEVGARVVVLDVRDELPRATVDKLRRQGVLIVTIDDPSDRRLAADLAFYPPVPQVRGLDWSDFKGQLFVGWEWVVLRREFARPYSRSPHERPMVLVTMGGSDPAGLTLKAVEALDLLEDDFESVVVLGPGFSHHEALEALLAGTERDFIVKRDVVDMAGLMAQADLAVASFGVTAYELAAMEVPAVHLCLTEDHAESASAFVEAGVAQSLGLYGQVAVRALAGHVRQMISHLASWKNTMRLDLVDGLGAHRIAVRILDCLEGRQ